MRNTNTLPRKLEITIRPVKNMQGDFIAYYKSEFLTATYSVYFKDTIMGALALNAFYEMLKHKYKKEIEFTVSEHELQFKNKALLDALSERA
jgi:hypothetical protein